MGKEFFRRIALNPIIAAINKLDKLDKALSSPCENFFLLSGNICNIKEVVKKVKSANKGICVHADLMEGVSKDIWGLKYIIEEIKPDGIITTKSNIVKLSKELNVFTIQRLFILDSLSLESGIKSVRITKPDAVEILPGIMPRAIKEVSSRSNIPIITGGLITEKQDVINSLNSGAIGVSTSNERVWYM